MNLPLVLNDLSAVDWPDGTDAAHTCLREFASAMRELVAMRADAILLSKVRIPDLLLGSESSLQGFLGQPAVKEEVLFLFGLANKAPYALEAEDIERAEDLELRTECRVGPRSSLALLHWDFLKGVLVSFPSAESWREPRVVGQLMRLGDGAIDVLEEDISAPNVSLPKHVELHAELIGSFGAGEPKSGAEIWAERAERFPHLQFLHQVEQQLRKIPENAFAARQVFLRLQSLEAAVACWRSKEESMPRWKTKVSPESETRKNVAMFVDGSGVEHNYEWHARFTPGAGRIHFRVMRDVGLVEVAYIGEKLD